MAVDRDEALRLTRELQAYTDEDEISTADFKIGDRVSGKLTMPFDRRTRRVIGYAAAATMLLGAAAGLAYVLAPLVR